MAAQAAKNEEVTMSEELVFRVVLVGGEVREVEAERASPRSPWRAEYSLDSGHHANDIARCAVASLVASLGWDFVEILAPGEPSRAELRDAVRAYLAAQDAIDVNAANIGAFEDRIVARKVLDVLVGDAT